MSVKPTFMAPEITPVEDDFDIDARPSAPTSTSVGSGWGDAEKLSSPTTGDFPVDFRHSESIQVIKFIDPDGPFATYKQHFLVGKPGKKSYVCAGGTGSCPLCTTLNNRAEEKRSFTIINFSAEGGPASDSDSNPSFVQAVARCSLLATGSSKQELLGNQQVR